MAVWLRRLRRDGCGQRLLAPPQQAEDPDQDGQAPGERPVDEHGGDDLGLARRRRPAGDQHRLHHPGPARGEGDGGGQAGEGEHGQDLGPADLGVADPDVAQADQQHQVERQVADHGGRGDREPAVLQQVDGRLRNFTVAISQPCTGRRIRASSRETTRPATIPTFSAIRSLRSISANTTMAAIRPPMPKRRR